MKVGIGFMPINVVIQQKRKALGYTQEQVARYLGVSTPAVNKWEKGVTSPDMTLLAPLARLLKTDINTLLCFKEELTKEEIMRLLEEINDIAKKEGIEKAFEIAKCKVKEYPSCDLLIFRLAELMEGLMIMEGEYHTVDQSYREQIKAWYESCITSDIEEVRNGALYLLASKAINNKAFEEAKNYVERMPQASELDRNILEANLLLGLEKPDEAAELIEKSLRHVLMHFQNHILKLLDAELQAGQVEKAKEIAEAWYNISQLMGNWRYCSYIGKLQVAVETKDKMESIKLLALMLESLMDKMNEGDSPLCHRTFKMRSEKTYETFLPGLINDLKNNPQYDFLREQEEFLNLLTHYESMIERK